MPDDGCSTAVDRHVEHPTPKVGVELVARTNFLEILNSFVFSRRYGVVDNRFCFEGGSSCGKGEGLYVFVTDLGEEITHTLKLASQGKLASKKRAAAKKLAGIIGKQI